MKIKIVSILLSIILVFASCDYLDDRLKINNLTTSDIIIETYLDSVPDINETNKTEYYNDNIIKVGESISLTRVGSINGWPFYISNSKNKKLNLFVFQVDSLKKYNKIDSLIKYKIYKKYEFSEDNLVKANWTLSIY